MTTTGPDVISYSDALGTPVAQPERIGRYIILRHLGAGGMGVAFVAYDEALRREVVIKLVLPSSQRWEQAQRRLLREARALAQLSHPNIVSIFEVDRHQGQVFLVMELIVGQTVSDWLKTPRPYREVLSIFRQAGAGLAAAHAVGLVHRDFKPSNVMIGRDGRARVLDFGMVRKEENIESSDSLVSPFSDFDDRLLFEETVQSHESTQAKVDDAQLTRPGVFMGTPPFASPEQFRGEVANQKTDQFSFCVSLYLALYRQRPFSGRTVGELVTSVQAGSLEKPPRSSSVPGWVWPIVSRGLELDPDKRWPSMQSLLTALDRDASVRKRRNFAIAGIGVTAALTIATVGTVETRPQIAAACQKHQGTLERVWNDHRRTLVSEAMRATKVPHADDVIQRTVYALDTYAKIWDRTYSEVCQTFVQPGQAETLAKEGLRCLSQRQQSLEGLVNALTQAEPEMMTGAVKTAWSLPRISSCSELEYLNARVGPPADPNTAMQVERHRAKILAAAELNHLGRFEVAEARLDEAEPIVTKLGYVPLMAHLELERGILRINTGRFDEAETLIAESFFLARRSRDHETAAEAARAMAFLTGYKRARREEGRLWVRMAMEELRLQPVSELKANLIRTEGILEEAEGRYESAIKLYKQAVEQYEALASPDHPDIASARHSLGLGYVNVGDWEKAAEQFEIALKIWKKRFGPRDARFPYLLNSQGIVLRHLGRYAKAEAVFRQCLERFESLYGKEHSDSVDIRKSLGDTLVAMKRPKRGLNVLREAEQIALKKLGTDHPDYIQTMVSIANALHKNSDRVEAHAQYQKAIHLTERALGSDHPALITSLTGWAELMLEAGRPLEARPLVKRALDIARKQPSQGDQTARAEFVMAQILGAEGQEESQAVRLAKTALASYERIPGVAHRSKIEAVRAWLADRPRP